MDQPPDGSSAPVSMRVSSRLVERALFNSVKNLLKDSIHDSAKGVIAFRYGKNFVLSTREDGLERITREDLVEVADHDPVRNCLLYLGKNTPGPYTPLLWFIFRAFPETNAVLILKDPSNKFKDLEVLEIDTRYINTKTSMDALTQLKGKSAMRMGEDEDLFMLKKLNEIVPIIKSLDPA